MQKNIETQNVDFFNLNSRIKQIIGWVNRFVAGAEETINLSFYLRSTKDKPYLGNRIRDAVSNNEELRRLVNMGEIEERYKYKEESTPEENYNHWTANIISYERFIVHDVRFLIKDLKKVEYNENKLWDKPIIKKLKENLYNLRNLYKITTAIIDYLKKNFYQEDIYRSGFKITIGSTLNNNRNNCFNCQGGNENQLLKCSCNNAIYCGKKCQIEDWKNHGKICSYNKL
jgi:hypothetical protein